MSATNLTKNLKLSQFVASDKPSWLGDVNGDNKKIDDGYGVLAGEISKANDTASLAKSQSDANTQTLTNVNSELEDYGNRITALEAGGGTEQLEQRVNTLDRDLETLQIISDTLEEDITQNGTDITTLKGKVEKIEPKLKTNSDNITSLNATTSTLSETVQNVNTSTLALQSDMTNVKSRLSITETTASNAFNKSQDNAATISTLSNKINEKTTTVFTTLNITDEPSNISSSGILAIYDGSTTIALVVPIKQHNFDGSSTERSIGTIDLTGIIPEFASKSMLFNTSTFRGDSGTYILNGNKPSYSGSINLSLKKTGNSSNLSSEFLFFITTINVLN